MGGTGARHQEMLCDESLAGVAVQRWEMRKENEISAHLDHPELPEILIEEQIQRWLRGEESRIGQEGFGNGNRARVRIHRPLSGCGRADRPPALRKLQAHCRRTPMPGEETDGASRFPSRSVRRKNAIRGTALTNFSSNLVFDNRQKNVVIVPRFFQIVAVYLLG